MIDEQEKDQTHYVHRITYSARERLVGVFILLVALFLLTLIGMNENTLRFFENKVEFHTNFSDAKGLSVDTLVKVLGLEVGKVKSLNISEDHRIHVTLQVYNRYRPLIRADSRVRLNRLAVIGTATIEISAGSPEKPQLPDGAQLTAEETPSLDELIEGLANLVNMGDAQTTVNMLTDLSQVIGNLKDITGSIRSGEGALGALIYEEQLHHDLSNAAALLEQVMANASTDLDEVKPLLGTARKAITRVDSALTVLNTELQQFPDVLIRLNMVLEEATRVLEALQRVWPISSAIDPQSEQQLIEAQPVNE